MTPTTVQLLFIAIGLLVAFKFFSVGFTITWLPLGWFVAESIPNPEIAVYVWLGFLVVFAFVLLRRKDVEHSRENVQRP